MLVKLSYKTRDGFNFFGYDQLRVNLRSFFYFSKDMKHISYLVMTLFVNFKFSFIFSD